MLIIDSIGLFQFCWISSRYQLIHRFIWLIQNSYKRFESEFNCTWCNLSTAGASSVTGGVNEPPNCCSFSFVIVFLISFREEFLKSDLDLVHSRNYLVRFRSVHLTVGKTRNTRCNSQLRAVTVAVWLSFLPQSLPFESILPTTATRFQLEKFMLNSSLGSKSEKCFLINAQDKKESKQNCTTSEFIWLKFVVS